MSRSASDLLADDGSVDTTVVRSITNGRKGGSGEVSEAECRAMREAVAEADTLKSACADFERVRTTVRRHARGACGHDNDAPTVDPEGHVTHEAVAIGVTTIDAVEAAAREYCDATGATYVKAGHIDDALETKRSVIGHALSLLAERGVLEAWNESGSKTYRFPDGDGDG